MLVYSYLSALFLGVMASVTLDRRPINLSIGLPSIITVTGKFLPLNPVGPGYSPYMSTCSEAIETRYISLDVLTKQGLIRHTSLRPHAHITPMLIGGKTNIFGKLIKNS